MTKLTGLEILLDRQRSVRHATEIASIHLTHLEDEIEKLFEEESNAIPLLAWALTTAGKSDPPIDEDALAYVILRVSRNLGRKCDPIRPEHRPGPTQRRPDRVPAETTDSTGFD